MAMMPSGASCTFNVPSTGSTTIDLPLHAALRALRAANTRRRRWRQNDGLNSLLHLIDGRETGERPKAEFIRCKRVLRGLGA